MKISKHHGYRISEGSASVEPRRTKDELGVGGELWRLGKEALMEAEKRVNDDIRDL
jgi:hypothetical protein